MVDKLIDIPLLSAFYMIYQYQPPLAIFENLTMLNCWYLIYKSISNTLFTANYTLYWNVIPKFTKKGTDTVLQTVSKPSGKEVNVYYLLFQVE